jgi:hypothetical protein
MAEQAIILIPDISGFTDFTGATEIDHAAHIITELLELIVASNETDFTLAEIEGDAVLFYRKGEPLQREQLIDQCLRMFANFHQRLMVIERDTVCQCGACQTASNLTLKFIVHFGYIKEIKVAQFVKATGIDMIVAHRLLKNDVGAHEYILITEPCCAAVGQGDANPKFLTRVRPEDIPDEDLRRTFIGVMEDDLIYAQPQGDEGRILATLRISNDEEARCVARRILDLHRELDRLLR